MGPTLQPTSRLLSLSGCLLVRRFPCIVITGKGQPDVATRLFVKRLKTDLKIPILGLFDSDPWGTNNRLQYTWGPVHYRLADLNAAVVLVRCRLARQGSAS